MGVLGHGYGIHGVPRCVRIAVHQMGGIAFAGLFARGVDYSHGDALQLVERHADGYGLVVLVAGLHRTAFAQVEGFEVEIFLLLAVQRIEDFGILLLRADGHFTIAAARDRQGHLARHRHAGRLGKGCLTHGADDEAHAVVASLHTVWLQRATLTTTVATQAGHPQVDVQVSTRRLRQLVWMGSQRHFQSRPGQSGSRHAGTSHKLHTITGGIGQGTPANVLAVAHALRFGEVDEEVFHQTLMLLDERTRAAVVVVVPRTAAVPCILLEFGGEFHHITQTGQHQRRGVRRDARLEFYRTVGIDGPYLVGDELEIVRAEGAVGQFLY